MKKEKGEEEERKKKMLKKRKKNPNRRRNFTAQNHALNQTQPEISSIIKALKKIQIVKEEEESKR